MCCFPRSHLLRVALPVPFLHVKSYYSCHPAVIGVPVGAPRPNFASLFCPPAVRIACMSRSYGRPDARKWIPPDDFQVHALRSTLLFFVNDHRPLLPSPDCSPWKKPFSWLLFRS